jgi:predicted lipid-binding transport protein (Tim44 family)
MRAKSVFSLACAGLVVAACNNDTGYQQPIGAVLGGAAGGLAGAQFGSGAGKVAATSAGALLGTLIGSETGRNLDRADQVYAAQYSPQQVPMAYHSPPLSYQRYVPPAPAVIPAGNCQFLQPTIPGATPAMACQAPNGSWSLSQ